MRIPNAIRGTLKRKKAFEQHKEVKVIKPKKEKFPAKRRHVCTYKSGLEEVVAEQIKEEFGTVEYEQTVIKFVQPSKNRKYKPDFVLPNGIIIETKGIFDLADRQKHEFIREQHPELDIRFVFTNSKKYLRKGAKTTYADWCTKHNFKYADKLIPTEWLEEETK